MERLPRYRANGIFEKDNNTAQRRMRSVARGGKNYLFIGTEAGRKAPAIAHSLIETAKFNGIYPNAGASTPLRASQTTRLPRSTTGSYGTETESSQTGRVWTPPWMQAESWVRLGM